MQTYAADHTALLIVDPCYDFISEGGKAYEQTRQTAEGVGFGFTNTDLDAQLKQRGIQKIILVGMVANTSVESTGRFGMELGYHVTLIAGILRSRGHLQ